MPTLTLSGHCLEYEWFGPRQTAPQTTLVMLHEGLGSVGMWGDFPAVLCEAAGLPAFVYSRRGYGRSDSLASDFAVDYMHHEATNVLPAILDAVAIEQAILLGHSDGASIALIYAGGTANHRSLSLVLEAPHVFVEDISIAGIEAARTGYQEGRLRTALERYHGTNTDTVFWAWNRIWLDPAFRSWNIEPYLPSVTVPVLVIQGEDDEYGTLAQIDAIERQCSGRVEKAILADCGHSPHRAQRDAVIDAVTRFVRNNLGD